MKNTFISIATTALVIGMCVSSFGAVQAGGTASLPAAELKRLASMPTPRTADGHPDLSGYWGPPPLTQNLVADRDVGPPPTYKPEHQKKVDELKKNIASSDPTRHCRPAGVPRMGAPWEIVQIPGTVY